MRLERIERDVTLQCCTSLGLQRRDIHGHRHKLLRAHRCRCYARGNRHVNIESVADVQPSWEPHQQEWRAVDVLSVAAAVDEHQAISSQKLRHPKRLLERPPSLPAQFVLGWRCRCDAAKQLGLCRGVPLDEGLLRFSEGRLGPNEEVAARPESSGRAHVPWRDDIGWSQDLLALPLLHQIERGMCRDVIVQDDDEATISHVLAQRWLRTKREALVRIEMAICTRTRPGSVGSREVKRAARGEMDVQLLRLRCRCTYIA